MDPRRELEGLEIALHTFDTVLGARITLASDYRTFPIPNLLFDNFYRIIQRTLSTTGDVYLRTVCDQRCSCDKTETGSSSSDCNNDAVYV